MFNVIILGGEDTENYSLFKSKCIYYLKDKGKSGDGITIFTTGDSFVEKFANSYGIDTKQFYTDWDKYGKSALFNRNKEIVKDANAIIYFDTGKKDQNALFNYALKLNVPSRKVETT